VVCGECGATIADKAIVCYRCGAPTETPVARKAPAGPSGTGARRSPILGLALVLGAVPLGWFSIEADPASLEQYGSAAGAAVSALTGAWRLWRR
jgi:hypothetical protein